MLSEDGALSAYGIASADVERELRVQIAGWVSEADALRAVGFDPGAVKDSARRMLVRTCGSRVSTARRSSR